MSPYNCYPGPQRGKSGHVPLFTLTNIAIVPLLEAGAKGCSRLFFDLCICCLPLTHFISQVFIPSPLSSLLSSPALSSSHLWTPIKHLLRAVHWGRESPCSGVYGGGMVHSQCCLVLRASFLQLQHLDRGLVGNPETPHFGHLTFNSAQSACW